MTIEALAFINETLTDAGINYEFGEWSKPEIPSPYFIGEFIDEVIMNEDGESTTQFILTGTSKDTWLELMESKEIIEDLFPSINGKVAKIGNGSMLAVFFDNANIIPTNTMDLKRIQINLTVKEWKGR